VTASAVLAVQLSAALRLAAVPSPPAAQPRIAPDGAVTAPEGARFRLPRGLVHAVAGAPGSRVYTARSADGLTFAGVSVSHTAGTFGCGDGAAELGLEPSETARGLAACRLALHPEGSPYAIAAVLVNAGAAVVNVNVLAPGTAAAAALAGRIADSVEIGAALAAGRSAQAATVDLPRADPRLVGCFRRNDRHDAGRSMAHVRRELCLAEDFTFTRTSHVEVATPAGGAGQDFDEDGLWLVEGQTLTLAYEDEDRGSVADALRIGEVAEDRLVLDGAAWIRQVDRGEDDDEDGDGEDAR
jgi:hypothetical protein